MNPTFFQEIESILHTERLDAYRHGQFTESAKLEQTIQANLPARRSAQREGRRGLGYGG